MRAESIRRGSALAFTLQLLGRHQDVQERARAEATEATADTAGGVYDIERLPYIAQVIDESMRLYTPADTVVRKADADTELLGYSIPAGRSVAVNIWGTHHRPDVWRDPSTFAPDRFEERRRATDASGRAGGCTHVPFAGGPRACIGEHLAMAELVAGRRRLLANYRLRSELGAPPTEVDLALRPQGQLPCLFERI